MIKLMNGASGVFGNPVWVMPENIISVEPFDNTTKVKSINDLHFVIEPPEKVVQKVIEYKLALVRYQNAHMKTMNHPECNEEIVLDASEDILNKLSGLEF